VPDISYVAFLGCGDSGLFKACPWGHKRAKPRGQS